MTLIVNAVGHEFKPASGRLYYEDAVSLAALPAREDYTIVYRVRNGNTVKSGSLSPRAWVPVEDGMVIDVAHTGNA